MNKFFAVLLMCTLALPVIAIEEQEAGITPITEESVEVVQTEDTVELNTPVSVEQKELPAPNQNLNNQFKEPVSKKKLAKKFLIAMLCVVGTSIFLYGALSIYNKIRDFFGIYGTEQTEGGKALESPSDLTEAVKSFVEKTHWDN